MRFLYAMMNLSHIILRKKEPGIERGFKAPGGIALTGISFALSLVAIVSTFTVDAFRCRLHPCSCWADGVLLRLFAKAPGRQCS